MLIFRDDGDGNGVLQGRLVVEDLVEGRSLPDRKLAKECETWRVRYEINHRRQVSALLVRPQAGATAAADTVQPIYDIGEVSSDPLTIVNLDAKAMGPLLSASTNRCPVHILAQPPGTHARPLVSAEEMSPIRCVASTSNAAIATAPPAPAPPAPAPRTVAAWLGPVLTVDKLAIPREGRITLYLVNAAMNKEVQTLTVEPRPRDPENPDMAPAEFPFAVSFRLALTADGRFALLIGDEAMYWETTDVEEWLTAPEGMILRRELKPPPQELDWWREPFCGKH